MSDNRGVDMCSIRSFAAFLLLAGAAAQSAPNPAVDRIFARVRDVRFRLAPRS